MALFDAPTREVCSAVRGSTNTPLQALVVMNDPQYVEAAVAFGKRMIDEGGTSADSRLNYGFRVATGRVPTTEEQQLLTKSLERHLKRYADDLQAASSFVGFEDPELAAYAMVGTTLLNLDELISRP